MNQSHDDILLHTCLSDCHQKGHITNVGKDIEERKPLYIVGGNVGVASLGNNIQIPQKTKIRLTYDPEIPLLIIYI